MEHRDEPFIVHLKEKLIHMENKLVNDGDYSAPPVTPLLFTLCRSLETACWQNVGKIS